MNESEFLLQFPVYMVVDVQQDAASPLCVATSLGPNAVAVFTEELLAERAREWWKRPHAQIDKLSRDELAYILQALIDYSGIQHAAIDPFAEPGQGKSAVLRSLDVINNRTWNDLRNGDGGDNSAPSV